MPRFKPITFLLGLYIPVLLVGLLIPRQKSGNTDQLSLIKRIFHEILFLSGPAEIFLNFLLFIPFFFALVLLAPAVSPIWAAIISIVTSALAEMVQSQILGRVSSLRDFCSNCVGVFLACVIFHVVSRRSLN